VTGSPDLQVVAPAFEECARTFTDQGRTISCLAAQMREFCAPLGDQFVGGDQCATLSQQANTLVRALDTVGTGGCAGVARALQQLLASFQELDRGQAASSSPIRPATGGG
jgi:uncharacterized protein YukE